MDVQLGKEGGVVVEAKETLALQVCGSWIGLSLLHMNFAFSVLPRLFFFPLFLSCSLSNSGMRFFITTDWLSSMLTVICGSSRHLRIEIDLGHLCSRGVIAVVTAPVSKATTAFWL